MALTDTFVRNAKSDKSTGQKHADGNGMYLLVTPTGKYWRLDYRHLGKRKTLALGVYPTITLAKARTRCADARRLIADGLDPLQAKQEEKQEEIFAASQTFEIVARMWMQKTAANRAVTTGVKVTGWLEKDVFPYLGSSPVSTLTPRDVLVCIQRMEARGVHESA
ncbi:MAG: integrase family protein, partial [Massilia sp.]|nr:integrase family protein [Massilia sp.]